MGCLRWMAVGGLLAAAALCGLLLLVGRLVGGPLDQLMTIAQAAPTRSLAQALGTDGVAWVKVRFELASGATPLVCAGQPCLHIRTEEYRTDVDDIRIGGTWTRRLVERLASDAKQFVAFDLVDGATRLTIDDPLGVKVWSDLLQERREFVWPEAHAAPTATATGTATATATGTTTAEDQGSESVGRDGHSVVFNPDPMAVATDSAGDLHPDSGLVDGRIRRVEAYLPVGAEGWVLGRFVGGRPQVLDNGMFVLTSLGPERFGKTMADGHAQRRMLQSACAAGLMIFPLLAVYLVLKRR